MNDLMNNRMPRNCRREDEDEESEENPFGIPSILRGSLIDLMLLKKYLNSKRKRLLFSDPEDNDDDVAYGDYKSASVYDEEPEYEEDCDNLIAEEAVQKLGLKTVNHPKPCKLQWLKKGGEVTVSKRVRVPFL
nr:putative reverse transcriptase domain-containing protein [Tanacetum cinerariifolium]